MYSVAGRKPPTRAEVPRPEYTVRTLVAPAGASMSL
jgi:hypothetical protein